MAVGIAVLCLSAAMEAGAADPGAAVVSATADGLNASMLEIVDSTIISKVESLGYETVQASSVSQAKAMGVDKIVTTHMVRSGDEVLVRLSVIDAKSGSVAKGSAKTTTSGVLAEIVKLLKKSLPRPAPKAVAPVKKPAPKAAAPVKKPAPKPVHMPEPVVTEPVPASSGELELVHGVWEDMYRSSTALLAAGTVATLAGVGFAITAAVLWKRLEDYQDWAEENACRDCITTARDKMKVNLAVTGVGIGLLLPGVFVLVSGIGKRAKALKLKDEMARLVPDMNLAISPRGKGGELTLTWNF
ncbi:MAG: hypothetical protein JRG91_20725 [Deltaproteobacteria bacterium]|nr:hypothetical protein [Deltaproteobacteria bacterium]